MDLLALLEYVGSLNDEQKEQALADEFERQRKYVDAMCNIRRTHPKEN